MRKSLKININIPKNILMYLNNQKQLQGRNMRNVNRILVELEKQLEWKIIEKVRDARREERQR